MVLQRFRVTVCNALTDGNTLRSSRAVADTDEDTDHILITNDSQTKLNVVRQLEPWSSKALMSFLWIEPRTL